MAKLHAFPAQSIIDGLKGVIDYYVHYQTCDRSNAGSGTPCARSWPRSPGQERAPAVEAQWGAFSYAAKNWNSLDPYVQDAYKATVQETNLTPRDLFTKAFITDYFREGQWDAPALPPPPIIEEYLMLSSAYAYLSADLLNLVNGVATKVPFDKELFDINGDFDTVNSWFLAPKDGRYLLSATIAFKDTVADRDYNVAFKVNGVWDSYTRNQASIVGFLGVRNITILDLDAGDKVDVWAVSNSGGNTVDIYGSDDPNWTRFEVSLIE